MRASIVKIGNSQGIRIPKLLLEQTGIEREVEIEVGDGELRIVPIQPSFSVAETALLSDEALARDWSRPEEDEAWSRL